MKIDPCPFCESTTLEISRGWCTYFVHCSRCNADGPEDTNRIRAVRGWNVLKVDDDAARGKETFEARSELTTRTKATS